MSTPLVLVMGVAGSGKTSVGAALAERLGLDNADADAFHSQANVAKMAGGHPLNDHDRRPWLEAIGAWLAAHDQAGGVARCSALHRAYRDVLRMAAPRVRFLHLDGAPRVVAQRVASLPTTSCPRPWWAPSWRPLSPSSRTRTAAGST